MDTNSKSALVDFINSNLSQIPFKTLREHEQEPSDEHKLHAMKEILYTDPGLFLSKWGKYLPNEQLSRFEVLRDDYEVQWHLEQFKKERTEGTAPIDTQQSSRPSERKDRKVLNRRYVYLITRLDNTAYFSDEEMEMRDPLLYEEYVGKYIPDEERYRPFTDDTNLVDRMYYDIDQHHIRERRELEQRIMEEQTAESETSDEEDVPATPPINGTYNSTAIQNGHRTYSMDVDTSNNNEASPTTNSDQSADVAQGDIPQISEEEKRGLRDQLVDIMRAKFLSGDDRIMTFKMHILMKRNQTKCKENRQEQEFKTFDMNNEKD
ncbi:1965_t:CDS:2 [Paraglomus occultum]|uniref:1965_t:CDS:1 n=1 Tax=Paraglomus occultum TaxID=144539 RepID=A0A9N9FT04_9GLOM|nr:1965_t:CDS:2 [Paraglomus occultum]